MKETLFKFFDYTLGIHREIPAFHQMVIRAIIIYFVAIILLRLGKRRALQPNSPFDIILIIIFGNVLADAIVGSWPFFECLGIMVLLFIIHSIISALSFYFPTFEYVLEDAPRYLIKNGEVDWHNLRRCHISQNDLISAVRRNGHVESFDQVKHAILETNGDISIIKK